MSQATRAAVSIARFLPPRGREAGALDPDQAGPVGGELPSGAGPVIRWFRNRATWAARRLQTPFGPPPATRSIAVAAAWLISARLRPRHRAGFRVTVM